MEKSDISERKPYIIRGKNPYKDERGEIINFELVAPINLYAPITSRAGTIRANHYHPLQTQQCHVISGKYISVFKDLSKPDAPVKHHLVQAGDLEVMPPMVAHAMIFLENSYLVNLVGGNRDHDKYNKEHTFPYLLVHPADIAKYSKFYQWSK